MLERTLVEYNHLQKTKVGIDTALYVKGIKLATECRHLVAAKKTEKSLRKLMAEFILEKLNGR